MICALLPNESQVLLPAPNSKAGARLGSLNSTSSHAWNFSLSFFFSLSPLSLSLPCPALLSSLSQRYLGLHSLTHSLTHFWPTCKAVNPIETDQNKTHARLRKDARLDQMQSSQQQDSSQTSLFLFLSLPLQVNFLFCSVFLVCVSLFFPFCDSTFIPHQCWIVKCGRSTAVLLQSGAYPLSYPFSSSVVSTV